MKEDNKASKQVFIGADRVCERRKLDAQRIATYFTKNGYEIVTNPKKAEIIIIFTCGVTNDVADVSLNYVKKFMEYDGELIVAGCLPETDTKVLDELFTGNKFSAKEMEKIDTFFPEHEIKFHQISDTNIPWINLDETRLSDVFKKIMIRTNIGRKMYVYFLDYVLKRTLGKNYLIAAQFMSILYSDYCVIRVSQGCLNDCVYCVAKKAIGIHKSKPLDECVQEFKKGLKKGYTKFILTGDDTGAYGVDIGSNFPELLDTLTKIDGCYTITIHAVNPTWVVKYASELEPILRRGKITIMSVPVQSGSDRVLKMMHRFSGSKEIKEALVKVKKAYPGLVLDTHVIVGFPSETVDEFKESLKLIKEVGFDFGSLIPLSIRPDTELESIKTKAPDPEIKRKLEIASTYLNNLGYSTNKSVMGGIIFSKKN